MNDLEKANSVWQDKHRALNAALAGLKLAQQRESQRDINYYWELIRQAQQSEASALSDVKRLMT